MPASTKDYVLFMLFIKYVSDKYANSDEYQPAVVIPKGASFADTVAMKGRHFATQSGKSEGDGEAVRLLDSAQVEWIESAGNYVRVYT